MPEREGPGEIDITIPPPERERPREPLESYALSVANERHPERNEDAKFVSADGRSLGIFDGMGGEFGGDVASSEAREFFEDELAKIPGGLTFEQERAALHEVFARAKQRLIERRSADVLLRKMDTTAIVVRLWRGPKGERKAWIGHAGDSRAYVIKADGKFQQLTIDDSIVDYELDGDKAKEMNEKIDRAINLTELTAEESYYFQRRNVVTNVLGDPEKEPTFIPIDLAEGDELLLTTDGIHDNLTENEIAQIASSGASEPMIRQLVTAAQVRSRESDHLRAKPDDMTAIVARIPVEKTAEMDRLLTVADAKDWEQLDSILAARGGIEGKSGRYSLEELRGIIRDVRSGKLDLSYVTRTEDLRITVERLLNQDAK